MQTAAATSVITSVPYSWFGVNRAAARRVLVHGVVQTSFVVLVHILAQQPPRQERCHISLEDRVVVENHVSIWKRSAQLLPSANSRVTIDVEVADLPATLRHHEETVPYIERQRQHGKEHEGRSHLAVVSQKPSMIGASVPSVGDAIGVNRYNGGGAPSSSSPVPSWSIAAGHAGHIARIIPSQPSNFSRNLRARAYPALPSWLTSPKAPNSGMPSGPRLGLSRAKKQIPQVVAIIEIQTYVNEPLEGALIPYRQEVGGSSPSPPTITR